MWSCLLSKSIRHSLLETYLLFSIFDSLSKRLRAVAGCGHTHLRNALRRRSFRVQVISSQLACLIASPTRQPLAHIGYPSDSQMLNLIARPLTKCIPCRTLTHADDVFHCADTRCCIMRNGIKNPWKQSSKPAQTNLLHIQSSNELTNGRTE